MLKVKIFPIIKVRTLEIVWSNTFVLQVGKVRLKEGKQIV